MKMFSRTLFASALYFWSKLFCGSVPMVVWWSLSSLNDTTILPAFEAPANFSLMRFSISFLVSSSGVPLLKFTTAEPLKLLRMEERWKVLISMAVCTSFTTALHMGLP